MNQPTAPASPESSSQNLLDQAQHLLTDSNAAASLKQASGKAVSSFNKLSTTQKVVGGTLLAVGVAYLFGGKKRKAKKRAATLDELLLFVNDRIEGYKRAADDSQDAQLRSYYQRLIGQSQQFASTLNSYLTQQGAPRETGTTTKGKVYRKFMDAAAAVTGHDEKTILATNIHGEQWAIAAYKKALRGNKLKGEIRATVEHQYAQSQQTYQRLKQLAAQQK